MVVVVIVVGAVTIGVIVFYSYESVLEWFCFTVRFIKDNFPLSTWTPGTPSVIFCKKSIGVNNPYSDLLFDEDSVFLSSLSIAV